MSEQLALDDQAFRALATLTHGGRMTLTSLDLDDEKPLSFDRYEKIGGYLGAMNRACSWWLGDWLLYGEGTYGERFAQAITATGLHEETLRSRMFVCGQVPPSRRKATLRFSVHALVAKLPPKQQSYWLDKTEKQNWTATELTAAMRDERYKERDKQEKIDVPREGKPFSPEMVLEAARRVVGSAREYGADYLVPREEMAKLRAAVGEEE